MNSRSIDGASWTTAWPDALAFAAGLVVAGMLGWQTSDLMWSLWLSSLVVGYASMAWPAVRAATRVSAGVVRDSSTAHPAMASAGLGPTALFLAISAMIGLGIAAFMTLHFVGFHVAHGALLAGLFPLEGVTVPGNARELVAAFGEIFQRYWMFLPSAFVAERVAFTTRAEPKDDGSVTMEAIEARKRKNARAMMTGPYRNVIRMHLLIFFLGVAHFAGMRSAVVYIVVYAVYFFPWRMLPSRSTSRIAAAPSPGHT